MRAILIDEFGGPEQLKLGDVVEPEPGDGQLLLDVSLAGVNYADIHRVGNDHLSTQPLPFVPGQDVAGRLPDGSRAVSIPRGGGYAERVAVPTELTFPIADGVTDEQALALVIQGATAWHLLRTAGQMRAGESVGVFAAAGGVGSVAVQLARAWGAGTIIAIASSDEKRAAALRMGADVAVDARSERLTDDLIDANGGRPLDVVLEMSGGSTFTAALAAVAPFGRIVHYGTASREVPPPVEPRELMVESRGVIGFWLQACGRAMMLAALEDLWRLVGDGRLDPVVATVYPMSEARRAHEDLAARRTIGKLMLDPRT